MSVVVMKFGGSSLSNLYKMRQVADKIIKKKKDGNKIIVVVSALGDTTDDLINLINKITYDPIPREFDTLLSTGEIVSASLLSTMINSIGEKAISLTGYQAGIKTNNDFMYAKIKEIDSTRIKECLLNNMIVIVTGFQGVSFDNNVTTLGRGGSDLTAVVLAAALKSDFCEIYSDVEGVYTVDPNIVKNAKKINIISYDEMIEMASSGAQVLQTRSVLVAKKFNVKIYAKCSFNNKEGTIICDISKNKEVGMESSLITGIAFDKDQVKISIIGLLNIESCVTNLFDNFINDGIYIDMLTYSSINTDINNTISFTIDKQYFVKAKSIINNMLCNKNVKDIFYNDDVSKISIIGIGIKSDYSIVSKILKTFSDNKVNILMIYISEIKISIVVDKKNATKSINELHYMFKL
ncbi:MAG: aspartate kinase [Endomicrobium sp.]|jgi:aspartate kinase|nr:aspartate kinase [Endomicrobium sp.]